MSYPFSPRFWTTAIGSFPFIDTEEAVSFVLDAGLSIPLWPQLPKRHWAEDMIAQYSENMPCVRFDTEKKRVFADLRNKPEELTKFYEDSWKGDSSLFEISSESAAGLYGFERMAGKRKWPLVKGQTTGPITFSLRIFDEEGHALYRDPDLRDAAVQILVRRVQWQIERLRPFASGPVIIFVDEPTLGSWGQIEYLTEERVLAMLREVFEAISGAGGITGIHICGNTKWDVVLRSGAQIVSFDAYNYGDKLTLYPSDLAAFFERGGSVAWGIVPTDPTIDMREQKAEDLVERMETWFQALEEKGVSAELLQNRAIITPSCGTGPQSVDGARHIFKLLADVQRLALAASRG